MVVVRPPGMPISPGARLRRAPLPDDVGDEFEMGSGGGGPSPSMGPAPAGAITEEAPSGVPSAQAIFDRYVAELSVPELERLVGLAARKLIRDRRARQHDSGGVLLLSLDDPDDQAYEAPGEGGPDVDIDADAIKRRAGEMLTSSAVAALLGQTRQSVHELQKNRRILGVRFGNRWRYPSVQFRRHEILPGLPAVVRALDKLEPWKALEVLIAPQAPVHERPIILLHQGNKAGALAAASFAAAKARVAQNEISGSGQIHPELDADLEADLRREDEIAAVKPFA